VASLWLGLIAYAFQIYYDFSGYSDMAIGLGRILGFSFPENFNYPYVCESITDFWRRWHITLSSWFREYVYIPLGGNRRGKLRTYVNLFVVWSLTGLWHGAGFNFLLWGLYFFVILVLEKAFLLKILKALPHMIRLTYALVLILVGWFIFYSDGASATDIFTRIISLFGVGGIPFTSENIGYVLISNLPMLVLMAVGATPLPKSVLGKLKALCPTAEGVLRTSLTILSFVVSTAYLVDNGFNPFLYFRF
jgi:alginate O-acetyltransferase complex protein AlgI